MTNDWGHEAAFIDLRHLGSAVRPVSGFHPLTVLSGLARNEKLQLTYVVPLRPSTEFVRALRPEIERDERGVGVRLTVREGLAGACQDDVGVLLDRLRMHADDIDLFLDAGVVDEAPGRLIEVTNRLGRMNQWRSLTVVGGSFPKDLQRLRRGSNVLPRTEWENWQTLLRGGIVNAPRFGDFTIQWAHYEEPPEGANPSASIRYTTRNGFLVMRGEALRAPDGGSRYHQYPANAQLLFERPEFCGEGFSFGDRYIWEVATGCIEGTGNAMTWLRAGINHHMTLVVRQLRDILPSDPNV